jgi:TolB-like protein/class 3 adenylate cyclase
MFTDMVGYTALGQRNESLSLALVEEQRKLIRPILARHNGREIKTIGDAFLVEFLNALDAVRCAYEIQRATREYNIPLPPESRIHLRIGLHLGDVVESQGDISGDAVNVASRIEPLAEDGGVCLTRPVYESMHNKLDVPLVSVGMKSLKNVSEPMEVYRMLMPWEQMSATKEEIVLPRDRIAILPFANMSPDPNDEYFADGMTEEIISTVSGISGLKVISRTSVMGYKGTAKKVREIGRELEVGSVLEGSFRKAGNRIRVTTQLINVADDEHLWAQNYDRNLDDVFEVQSDVAKQVAEALRVKILSPEKERIEMKPTESTEAYTSYLKGTYLYGKRVGERPIEAVREAAMCFERAVEEDPGFALGYVGIAGCCVKLAEWGIEIEANVGRARSMASKALELDPGLADAHSVNGWALMYDYEVGKAEEEFRRAIELKPSDASAHNGYCIVMQCRHRWDDALKHIERAVELDPLSPVLCGNHGWYYVYSKRDYQRALELCKRAVELGGSQYLASVAFLYGKMRMFDDMKREYAAWVELVRGSWPLAETIAHLWMAYFEDDKETVRSLLPKLEARFGKDHYIDAMSLASGHLYLKEDDKGFEWLECSYSRREPTLLWVSVDPSFDSVRTDSRYLNLLKRLGVD